MVAPVGKQGVDMKGIYSCPCRFLARVLYPRLPRRWSRRPTRLVLNIPAYARELHVASEAARKAAAMIRSRIGQLDDDEVREKGTNDLVTSVDEEAQRIILETLRQEFPDYEVLAEENQDLEDHDRRIEGYRWIIDPIDGTTNFTHGQPPFCVSIGLQHGAEMVVGVVLELGLNELFAAAKGSGLWVDGQRAEVSARPHLRDSLITTGFPFREFAYVDDYLRALRDVMGNAQGVRRPGSAAADLAWTAAGRFDGFFEAGLSPWDVAAGIVLVREAGGKVSDFSGKDEVLFGQQMVASNGHIHDELVRCCAPMRYVHR